MSERCEWIINAEGQKCGLRPAHVAHNDPDDFDYHPFMGPHSNDGMDCTCGDDLAKQCTACPPTRPHLLSDRTTSAQPVDSAAQPDEERVRRLFDPLEWVQGMGW
jgi:hypothetical protein